MSDTTSIEWAKHTGGPWLGCTKVSPGCTNCYACGLAETRHEHIFRGAYKNAGFADWETRTIWGDNATRVLTKGFWQDAYRINRMHAQAGTRGRWFPSLIDWLDEMPAGIIDQGGDALNPAAVLADFLGVIRDTPHLDWLLLTKRPQDWRQRMQAAAKVAECTLSSWITDWVSQASLPPENVWIGTTVEDQLRAVVRIPVLLRVPARVRFLSCEPLLGEIDFDEIRMDDRCYGVLGNDPKYPPGIDWVICGGESGPKARPMHPDWARSLRDQCAAAGVAFFFKQWGEHAPYWHLGGEPVIAQSFDPDFPRKVREGEVIGGSTEEAMVRVGKKRAGRLLDGVEHSAFPIATPTALL